MVVGSSHGCIMREFTVNWVHLATRSSHGALKDTEHRGILVMKVIDLDQQVRSNVQDQPVTLLSWSVT